MKLQKIAIIMGFIVISNICLAFDELYLIGKLTAIKGNYVTFEIISESCHGSKTFKLNSAPEDHKKLEIGEFYSITLNTPNCSKDSEIISIHKVRR